MRECQQDRLARQFRSIAQRYLRRLPLQPADQQELLQTCMLQALGKGNAFLESLLIPSEEKHLHRFLRSNAGHFLRSRNTLKERQTSWPAPMDPCACLLVSASLEETVCLSVDLERALGSLPKAQRRLFLRRHLYREDYACLAREYETTEHAIRQRLVYIAEKLAEELRGHDE